MGQDLYQKKEEEKLVPKIALALYREAAPRSQKAGAFRGGARSLASIFIEPSFLAGLEK